MEHDAQRLTAAYEQRVRELTDANQQREHELEILSQLVVRIHGEDDEQAVFEAALDEIVAGLGVPAAWIFTGDGQERRLRLTASRGVATRYLADVQRNGLGLCLCPEVFWTGHSMLARNTSQCPRMPDIVEGPSAATAHACVPLQFEGSTRGVMNVAAPAGRVFSERELRFLDTVGHQVGIAVERARHRSAESVRNQEARAMAAVSKAVGGSLDLASVLSAVGATARDVLGADRVLVLLGDDPRAMRVAHAGGALHPELREGDLVDLEALDARLPLLALGERRPHAVDDLSADPRSNPELARRWDAGSALVLPMTAEDRALGLLAVTRRGPSRWTEEHLEVGEAFAAQASLKIDNARLYEEARRAYRELKDAQDQVIQQEKMAALGTFASGLAHEVRNPLNSIGLSLSILERRIGRLEEADKALEMGEQVSIIRDEVHRLDGLVGDFLLFSRSARLRHQPGDLEAVVDEVVRLLAPEAEASGVTIARRRVGDPVTCLCMDAEKMKQVVINVVRNAIEAMPEGGEVVVESGTADDQARLVVRDTGPGLPAGLDLFQLFVTTKPMGTGLGLSIVQEIVRQHGGDVTAENEQPRGARFTVTLPLRTAQCQEGARP
ncbi:MAG TPA: GAF domain-containing protein [Vicinamibacteria bacterium]|jgi:signal transduction histidine kinase